jgi:hypothetical protein
VQLTKLETNNWQWWTFMYLLIACPAAMTKLFSIKRNFIATFINQNLNASWGNEIGIVTTSAKSLMANPAHYTGDFLHVKSHLEASHPT